MGIRHPSQSPAKPVFIGPTTAAVASHAPVNGKASPLIVMSHATGDSYCGHVDTAMA
jgi:hypothetical protein